MHFFANVTVLMKNKNKSKWQKTANLFPRISQTNNQWDGKSTSVYNVSLKIVPWIEMEQHTAIITQPDDNKENNKDIREYKEISLVWNTNQR